MRKILTGAALIAPLLLTAPVQAQVINLVENGDFGAGLTGWTTFGTVTGNSFSSNITVQGGKATIPASTTEVGISQNLNVVNNNFYHVNFELSSVILGEHDYTITLGGQTLLSGTNVAPTAGNSISFYSAVPLNSGSNLLRFAFMSDVPIFGSFTLDNISVTEVPGPLPVLGLAAAFAWSRKLRRRIKDETSGMGAATPA